MKRIILPLLLLPTLLFAQADFNGFGDVTLSTFVNDSTFTVRIIFTGAYYDGGQHIVDSVKVGDYFYTDCSAYRIATVSIKTSGVFQGNIVKRGTGGQPGIGYRATVFRRTPSRLLLRGTIYGNDNYGIAANEYNCILQSLITQLDTIGTVGGGGMVDSTRIIQDSIAVYYQDGTEVGRDTIRPSGSGGGGGDNWGTQVVITDAMTLSGDGTISNPLEVNVPTLRTKLAIGTYANDSAAGTGGVLTGEWYILSQTNTLGLPPGTLRQKIY
jgi:hypothetical protein